MYMVNSLNLSVPSFSSKICIEQFKLVKANASREAYRASREHNQILARGRPGSRKFLQSFGNCWQDHFLANRSKAGVAFIKQGDISRARFPTLAGHAPFALPTRTGLWLVGAILFMLAALLDFIHYFPQQRRIDPELGILSRIVHLTLFHLLLHFAGDFLHVGYEKVADQGQCSGHALAKFWRVGFHLLEAPVCWVAHPLQAVVQAHQHFSERLRLDEIGAGSGQHSGYGL